MRKIMILVLLLLFVLVGCTNNNSTNNSVEVEDSIELTEQDIFNEEFRNSLDLSFKGIKLYDSLDLVNQKLHTTIQVPVDENNRFEKGYLFGTTLRFKKQVDGVFVLIAIFLKEETNSILIGDTKIGVAESMKLNLINSDTEPVSPYEKEKGLRFYFVDGQQKGMTIVMPEFN